MPVVQILHNSRLLTFGPFVGYYFKPENKDDLKRLAFLCFNEKRFYTRDLPENARIFAGEARFGTLPEADFDIPKNRRINPVFFDQAPLSWVRSRPEPRDEFVHFHSCHDDAGATHSGYWLRHIGTARFIYDMGGRVGKNSPLYHQVEKGPDTAFARIIEFDHGKNETDVHRQ